MGVSRGLTDRLTSRSRRLRLAVRQAVAITALAAPSSALGTAVSAAPAAAQNAPPSPPAPSTNTQQPPAPSSSPGNASAATHSGPPWPIVDPPQSTARLRARRLADRRDRPRACARACRSPRCPAYVPQAFIAVEDQRFYQHDGVDVVGVLGAIKDRVIGRPCAWREHDHAAARRQHAPRRRRPARHEPRSQAPGAGRGARDGAALHQGADPRGVPQPDSVSGTGGTASMPRRATTSARAPAS